jgi:hypothetical protein
MKRKEGKKKKKKKQTSITQKRTINQTSAIQKTLNKEIVLKTQSFHFRVSFIICRKFAIIEFTYRLAKGCHRHADELALMLAIFSDNSFYFLFYFYK